MQPITIMQSIHEAIRRELDELVQSAQRLLRTPVEAVPHSIPVLLERLRFLRSVCLYHASSEDEVLFPAALKRVPSTQAHPECLHEHDKEDSKGFEDNAHLLSEILNLVRRRVGEAQVDRRLERLVEGLNAMRGDMLHHMQEEEADVFPVVSRNFSASEQCHLVWRCLRAMPLRLLKQVLPWVAATLPPAQAEEMVGILCAGAPADDEKLLELLLQYVRTRPAKPHVSEPADHSKASQRASKRRKMGLLQEKAASPIDHIFQFHTALRVELKAFYR
eukprot:CAMPEP_0119125900 /NCGR_PEP_ID=MMETSP1310-20130426/5022_1 /TAXON_ID=464262 /ORGANISM="Genus nov. species nov., Strain RCC2339" /LENGTH=275 /DNA_ID=CAMNT_0007116019 /DNA_START=12 /DNA_END=835 /DNA_ORIENTATION=+